ncbi:MAG: HEAT repeat domain-containing protein, partial [Waddliaceae bacterium]
MISRHDYITDHSLYKEFAIHIGDLRTRKSLEYLFQYPCGREYAVLGLGQTGDPAILDYVLSGFESETWTDGISSVMVLLRFGPSKALPALSRFFDHAASAAKTKVLFAMDTLAHLDRTEEPTPGRKRAVSILKERPFIEWLARVALYDENKEVRRSAMHVLRSFPEKDSGLPLLAEKMFIEAIAYANKDNVKEVALSHLVYSQTEESLNVVKRATRDKNLDIAAWGLWVLSYRQVDFIDCLVDFLQKGQGL